MINERPKTVFCDIDGCLIRHKGDITMQYKYDAEVLPGTLRKIREWDKKGYCIILTTGRKESVRKDTERQLADAGIIYDQLVMGIGGGIRVLINDRKPDSEEDTAIAINLTRNKGFDKVDV